MTKQLTAKKFIRWTSIILLCLVIGGYGVWRSRDLLFGIRITTSGIEDGMTTTAPILNFYGNARHANGVTIDGTVVPIAQNGTWHDTIALLPGENTVTISAMDKFGRTISKRYQVYYQN